jgi:hypothetical protein
MKDAPWLTQPSARNSLCILSLMLAFTLLASSQQKTSSAPSDRQIYPIVGEQTRYMKCSGGRYGPGAYHCEPNFPEGFISVTVASFLPRPVRFDVRAANGDYDFAAQIAANSDGPPYGHGMVSSVATMRLPPGEYAVNVEGDGYLPGSAHIQGVSGHGYSVWVSCSETDKLLQATGPTPAAAAENPSTEATPSSIRAQVDRIANGTHQELPAPTETSVAAGQNPGWSIENATGYQLHLYVSGPVERDYAIPNGNSFTIDLPPGNYRIAATVSASNVIPFYAVRQLNLNARWTSHFYIAHK